MFPNQNHDKKNLFKDPYAHTNESRNSIYWRLKPHWNDWILLYALMLLRVINKLFTEKNSRYEALNLLNIAQEKNNDLAPVASYYLNRFKNLFSSVAMLLLVFLMISMQTIMEIDIISWIFLILNLVNLAFIIKGNTSVTAAKASYYIAELIKFYALFVLIL
jgi:hypothetical protein